LAEYKDREHFIPLRRADLVDMLCADPDLKADDGELFRQFCRLIAGLRHLEYNQTLERLKEAYAPFDPDSDCMSPYRCGSEERQQKMGELFSEFGWLLERANFKHLTQEEIAPALGHSSHWGLVVDVDFHMFERLAVFARGDSVQQRSLRRASGLYRKEELDVPVYKRLVMILKLRPHKRLGKRINTEGVYLQVFKDIPKLDINMLLPGARVRMSRLDRSKIGLPFLSGLGMAIYNIAGDFFDFFLRVASSPTPLFWGVATGAIGYGTRSYFSYVGTKQRYNLNLREVLYFQNLDTNAGVLLRLIDEAEEQDSREAILAYYFLWRHAGAQGWDSASLDDYIESDLERRCNLKIDFKVGGAINRLEKLRLVDKVEGRYRAQPIARALQVLEETWESFARFEKTEPATT
jgi:hypothetical protein